MSRKYTILYIHGMGGGVDSRIPSILNEHINEYVHDPDIRIDIVVRTYDIDPYIAERQISSWREELRPQLFLIFLFLLPSVLHVGWRLPVGCLVRPGLCIGFSSRCLGSVRFWISRIRFCPIIVVCGVSFWLALLYMEVRTISLRFSVRRTAI